MVFTSHLLPFCYFCKSVFWCSELLYANKDLKSLETVINIKLQNVCYWLSANKLTINAKKLNFVIFRPS